MPAVAVLVPAAIALATVAAPIYIVQRSGNHSPFAVDRIVWWLPLAAVIGASGILTALMLHGADDPIFFVLLIAPVLCFIGLLWLLVAAIRKRPRQCLSIVLALVGFVSISWSLDRGEATIRPFLRWLLWSERYKAQLKTQPEPANGEFKHLEWDSSGIVPTGFTVTYLVFDPSDSLVSATKTKLPSRFKGIPCEVPGILRLEKQWYAVEFYTDEYWRDCPSSGLRVPPQ